VAISKSYLNPLLLSLFMEWSGFLVRALNGLGSLRVGSSRGGSSSGSILARSSSGSGILRYGGLIALVVLPI